MMFAKSGWPCGIVANFFCQIIFGFDTGENGVGYEKVWPLPGDILKVISSFYCRPASSAMVDN